MSTKPTSGVAVVVSDPLHYGSTSTVVAGGETPDKWPHYRMLVQVGGSCDVPEQEANARLIADAFTVLHETGLTPRQLADQLSEQKKLSDAISRDCNQAALDRNCWRDRAEKLREEISALSDSYKLGREFASKLHALLARYEAMNDKTKENELLERLVRASEMNAAGPQPMPLTQEQVWMAMFCHAPGNSIDRAAFADSGLKLFKERFT